jgi:NAD(P)-dependent dehydrogenase (short-subunit alcohol dehydrogenase family)
MRTVLVTGGSGGIGRATARLAAREGYAVAVHYRSRPDAAAAVVDAIAAAGGQAAAFGADLAVEGEVAALFRAVDARFGRLDALVNNAGAIGWEGRLDDCEADRLAGLWATNLTSYFLCACEAVRRMSTARGGAGGAIVNVSSLSGRTGGRGGRIHYAASKGAINAMTLGLAREVADEGIRVNACVPAVTLTEIHDGFGGEERARRLTAASPLKRPAQADEVAEAIVWLLSDKASYVTGTLLDVTGGV